MRRQSRPVRRFDYRRQTMRNQIDSPADRFSRRRLLTIAGGATVAAALRPASIAARQDTAATPVAQLPATLDLPMPSTLAADASPLFRAVTEALVAAMEQSLVPG